MNIGAHISVSKGLPAVIEKAVAMGANSVQLFASPPRNWNASKFTTESKAEFKKLATENNIGPNFLHGIYLVNLHTDNLENREKGIKSVTEHMHIASDLGAKGVIIHSHRPNDLFITAIKEIVDQTPKDTLFIIEHSAVTTIEQTLSLFDKSIINRLGLCLDTCHLFAAGYDIRDKKVVEEILQKIDDSIGLDRLKVIHTNDCKSKFNSKRDNHQNIGEGSIGKDAFGLWINHSKLKNLPFVLETPGFDEKGPDKQNVDILKSLISVK